VRVHDHAERHGIHQSDVPAHQFSKGRFGTVLGVIAKQVVIGPLIHLPIVTRWLEKRTDRLQG